MLAREYPEMAISRLFAIFRDHRCGLLRSLQPQHEHTPVMEHINGELQG